MEKETIKDLENLIKDIHQTSKDHGFWDKPRDFGKVVSLIHSELSEALEFERNENNLREMRIDHLIHYSGKVYSQDIVDEYGDSNTAVEKTVIMSNMKSDICKKPDGVLPELADAVIRILDYVAYLDMSEEFINVILEKHEFNKQRPHMHGGKTF